MKLNNIFVAAALTASAVLAAFALPVQAADLPTLEVYSGAMGGTYQKFMAQASDVCRDEVTTHITLSPNGSEGNVDALEANSTSVAPVQSDFLYMSSQTQDLSNLKVVLVLFPESVHLVTLIESKHMTGGHLGMGQHPIVINQLTDIGPGVTVGTAGGGKVTAALIKQYAGLNYTIVPMDTSQNVLNALISGQVDVALVVGAAPMDLFRNAPPAAKAQIKFVSIPEALIPNLKGYVPSKVGYPGINNGVAAQTVAVQSVLVTQNYSKKVPMAASVYAFKQCLLNHAEEQAGMTGSHPAWRFLKADAVSKWPMWEYEPTAVTAPVKAKKTK